MIKLSTETVKKILKILPEKKEVIKGDSWMTISNKTGFNDYFYEIVEKLKIVMRIQNRKKYKEMRKKIDKIAKKKLIYFPFVKLNNLKL